MKNKRPQGPTGKKMLPQTFVLKVVACTLLIGGFTIALISAVIISWVHLFK